jgi:predicted secreted hydrolase
MRRLIVVLLVFALGLTTARADDAPQFAPGGFRNANLPWHFVFPRDHAAHDDFASEWWYYTGHLQARDGRRFGYELTFFRIGLRPGDPPPAPGQSHWRGDQLFPAHLALTDEAGKTFFHSERFAREALGAGSASSSRVEVRADGWSLEGNAPFHLRAQTPELTLALDERAEKPPAIHGRDGISRKAACQTCASHYYSITRLATTGTLVYHGERIAVRGLSWMDHEFGSGELAADQAGWDWFAIQLDDRHEMMLYRLRRKDGSLTPQSSGSLIDPDGSVRSIPGSATRVDALDRWTSPHTGATYPSGWRVRTAGYDLTLLPVLRDQELAHTSGDVSYWEGAVEIRDTATQRLRGVGYVELTGYAGVVRL